MPKFETDLDNLNLK